MSRTHFTVHHDVLQEPARRGISEFLFDVPFDPFIKDAFSKQFRQKALCRFNLAHNAMLEHKPLAQSREHNPVVQGMSRLYPPIPAALVETDDLLRLLRLFWQEAQSIYQRDSPPFSGDPVIMVQFQRTSCHKKDEVSLAVYEGAHQDGGSGSVLGLIYVDMHHVRGGKPLVYADRQATQPLYQGENWAPGSLLVFSDERCWHDAQPITCSGYCRTDAGGLTRESGYRDVIILYWDDKNCLMAA